MSDWDRLTEEQKLAFTRRRKLSGHTSIAEHQRLMTELAREQGRNEGREFALNEVCDWLSANGFSEASAALESVAFERPVNA